MNINGRLEDTGGMQMDPTEIDKMREKQIYIMNGLVISCLTIFFLIVHFFNVTQARFFFVLGVLLLIQVIIGFIKKDSTRSLIPILEKVAIYEKKKMGSEWYKQRKVTYVWNLILSSLMLMQSFWNLGSTHNVFQIKFMFVFIFTIGMLTLVNISLIIHIRKVDGSNSELEMKGYTFKSNIVAVTIGGIFALIVIAMMIFN
ncbi:hypothetical protein J2S13_000873 [Oikeobacillus pervagus]|uniref:Uncharacterized protein n=1 Tax=Oikeobacillus pervagus TaxID=1325931 RepID=A0AAJ1T044_9BACI|nr:hypothetical protein [Oikeobacillus pervagus]MDQ0214477.1 hypothetical protein [Oikeobacillus pervagus]